jgi:hypothetical protein
MFRNLHGLAIRFPDILGAGASAFRVLDYIFWVPGCLIVLVLTLLYIYKAAVALDVIRWEFKVGRRNLFFTVFMAYAFAILGAPLDVTNSSAGGIVLKVFWYIVFAWQVLAGLYFYEVFVFGTGPRLGRGKDEKPPPSDTKTKRGDNTDRKETPDLPSDTVDIVDGTPSPRFPTFSSVPAGKYDLDPSCFFTIIIWLLLASSASGSLSLPYPLASLTLYLGLPITALVYILVLSHSSTLPPAKAYNNPLLYLYMAPPAVACIARGTLVGSIAGDGLAESFLWISCFAYLFAFYALGGPTGVWKHLQTFGGWGLIFPAQSNAACVVRWMCEAGFAGGVVWGVGGFLVIVAGGTAVWMWWTTVRLGVAGKLKDVEFAKVWDEGGLWAMGRKK